MAEAPQEVAHRAPTTSAGQISAAVTNPFDEYHKLMEEAMRNGPMANGEVQASTLEPNNTSMTGNLLKEGWMDGFGGTDLYWPITQAFPSSDSALPNNLLPAHVAPSQIGRAHV